MGNCNIILFDMCNQNYIQFFNHAYGNIELIF
jgi:hypothetical protein